MSFLKYLENILAWIFPFYCLGCGQEDNTICQKCLEKIPCLENQCCPYCRINTKFGQTCDFCWQEGVQLNGLLVASVYIKKGLMAQALHNFKYNGQINYAEILIYLINKVIEQEKINEFFVTEKPLVICPIPLFPAKQKARGFNQSEILANHLNLSGKKISLLQRVDYKKAQMSLKGEERLINVRGAFQCRPENFTEEIYSVLLIDDVATTLATLEEAAKTLKTAGVKKVYGLVLGRENFENKMERL